MHRWRTNRLLQAFGKTTIHTTSLPQRRHANAAVFLKSAIPSMKEKEDHGNRHPQTDSPTSRKRHWRHLHDGGKTNIIVRSGAAIAYARYRRQRRRILSVGQWFGGCYLQVRHRHGSRRPRDQRRGRKHGAAASGENPAGAGAGRCLLGRRARATGWTSRENSSPSAAGNNLWIYASRDA